MRSEPVVYRRRGTALLGAALICGLWLPGVGWAARQPGETPRPANVLIVTVDTLRADRLSAYGYRRPTSPNLDRLIAAGVRFDNARTVEPLTTPALCSMLTSVHPHDHGATRNGLRLRSGVASLPKTLQEHGYRTAAFVGNWTLRDKLSGLAEHFEVYEEVLTRHRWFGLIRNEAVADDLTDGALEWLRAHAGRSSEEPFLLWLHYVEPHAPYRLQKDYVEQLGLERGDLPDADRYDTEIAYVDASIGKLIEGLDALPFADRTLVVFTSDHGESLGEHGYWGHGRNLYEPSLRIPMALSWPARIPAGSIDAPALNIDLAPTVLGLLGLGAPEIFQGFDWTGVMTGAAEPVERITQYQAHRGAVISRHDSDLRRKAGLLEVGMIHHDRKETFRIEKNRRRLFDLGEDPRELNNLTVRKESPSEGLMDWMRVVYNGLTSFDDTSLEPLDEESAEKLRSLGYVD
jgi:arylsulfatase A-like enzyme